MKKILILGGGMMQVPIIEKCNSLGIFTLVSDYSENCPGFEIASKSFLLDTNDKEANLKIAIDENIDGVITTSDSPVNTVAYICKKLNLKGISVYAAEISTSKYLQRRILEKSELDSVNFCIINKPEDLKNIENNLRFPLIIKPIDSSASRGVSICKDLSDLNRVYQIALKYSRAKTVIAEELIKGPEYSVETLTQNGCTNIVAITEKKLFKSDSYFVEQGHIIPALINKDSEAKILLYVHKLIELFHIDNTACHIELKLTEKGPILIEMGARLGGDFITSHLVKLSIGVDMERQIINIALGDKMDVTRSENNHSAIYFLHHGNYDKGKMLSKDKFYSELVNIEQYRDVETKSSMDRLGYFIFKESTREKLEFKINQLQ